MIRPLTVTAALLVVLTNLAALGLGALNRRSVESDIVLTERELRLVDEGSAVSLRLNWLPPGPAALTGDMVEGAGFATAVPPSDPRAEEYYSRQLQRAAFVALEFDGEAWARYREALKRQPPGTPGPPGTTPVPEPPQDRTAPAQNIEGHTRLFAVDVDADAVRLRSRHPDRHRYVIAGARVDVRLALSGVHRVATLSIRSIEPPTINVPRPFSDRLKQLASVAESAYADSIDASPRYDVHLRYGRFYEPWIVDVQPRSSSRPR